MIEHPAPGRFMRFRALGSRSIAKHATLAKEESELQVEIEIEARREVLTIDPSYLCELGALCESLFSLSNA
jgi:hypothetical protein